MTRRDFLKSAAVVAASPAIIPAACAAEPELEYFVIWGAVTDSKDWLPDYDPGDPLHPTVDSVATVEDLLANRDRAP